MIVFHTTCWCWLTRSQAIPSSKTLLRILKEVTQRNASTASESPAAPWICTVCPNTRSITTPSGRGMKPIRRATRSEWSVKACNERYKFKTTFTATVDFLHSHVWSLEQKMNFIQHILVISLTVWVQLIQVAKANRDYKLKNSKMLYSCFISSPSRVFFKYLC